MHPDPPNLNLKQILPGIWKVSHRKTGKLVGVVKAVGEDWAALAFTYIGDVPKQVRDLGLFSLRRDANAKVWSLRDAFTDTPRETS